MNEEKENLLNNNSIELNVINIHEKKKDMDDDKENSRILLADELEEEKKIHNPPYEVSFSKRERLYWIDALRVFANFLVIFSHSTGVDLKPLPFKSTNWKILFFYNSLPKPCVPLFIMISGIFFLDPKRPVTYSSLYKKSIPRLVRSYLFWTSYYSIIDDVFVNIEGIQYHFSYTLVRDILKKCLVRGGHLWYLSYAMGLYIVTPIFRELIHNKTITWYTTGLSILAAQIIPTLCDFFDSFTHFGFSLVREFMDSLRLSPVANYVNYFMLGYLLQVNTFTTKRPIYAFYAFGIIGLVSTVILRFASCYSNRRDSGAFGDNNSFNVTLETLGIFMFFKYTVNSYLPKLFKRRWFKKGLIFFSDCSFGIYLIHMTVYHAFIRLGFHPLSFNPIICGPLNSIAVYFQSVMTLLY